jgi:hypothetical protein
MPANKIDAALSIVIALGLGFIVGRAIFFGA